MAQRSRTPVLVTLALLVGVTAGAVGMMSLRGGDGPYATTPGQATHSMGGPPATTAFVEAIAGNCDVAPVLPPAGSGDGQAILQAKPGAADAGEIASLILSGKEAAAGGRQHDAEVSFLDACRKAAVLQDGDPIPLADAMYQLARLYANAGALGSPHARPLFQRAERLYSASLEAYRARYGEQGEKTRYARQGLQTVQQATGGKPPVAIAKAPPAPAVPPQDAAAVSGAPAAAPASAAVADATATAQPADAPTAAAAQQSAPAEESSAAQTPIVRPKPRSTRPIRRHEEQDATDVSSAQPLPPERAPQRTAPIIQARPQDVERAPQRRDSGMDQPPSRHAAPIDAPDEIALPPATASGSAGVAGGDTGQ